MGLVSRVEQGIRPLVLHGRILLEGIGERTRHYGSLEKALALHETFIAVTIRRLHAQWSCARGKAVGTCVDNAGALIDRTLADRAVYECAKGVRQGVDIPTGKMG